MQRGRSQVKQLYKHADFNNKISGILAAAIKPYEAQRGPELLPGMRSWYVSEMRRPLLRPGTRSSVTGEACAVLQPRVETTAKSSSQSQGIRQRSGAAAAAAAALSGDWHVYQMF